MGLTMYRGRFYVSFYIANIATKDHLFGRGWMHPEEQVVHRLNARRVEAR